MPYTIKKNSKEEFCVHKKGEDDKPAGTSLGCHKTKKEATDQIAAIESKENKKMTESVNYIQVSGDTALDSVKWDSFNMDGNSSGTTWYEITDSGTFSPIEPAYEIKIVEPVEEIVNEDNPYAIKALGGERIGGYSMIWGDEDRKDLHEEFFTPHTKDLTAIFDEIGVLPLIVHHASDEGVVKFVGGAIDVLEFDEIGLWFEAKTKEFEAYSTYVKPLMAKKMAYASSGTLPAARDSNKDTGEITRWPIAEVSVTWTPAEYRMLEHPLSDIKSAFAELGVDFPDKENQEEDSSELTNEETLGAAKARLKAVVNQELLRLNLLELD